ncbi:MAG: hypothetical protein NTY45_08360 [Elusimicrobia bacterium]|nr:hypothetical protein [Elusimicrobiota bacterium]
MATIFSEVLTQLRRDSGFSSAYSFYHDNGGAPVLMVSYRKYLLMEQGKILPVIDRLRRLFFALRLPPQSPQANTLVVAWLKTMAGEDNYRDILEPIVSPKAEVKVGSSLHEALKKSLADNKYFMSPFQFAAVVSSFDTYLCYLAMSSETGIYTVAELAKSLKLDKTAVAKAVKSLAEAKLLQKVRQGAYKCPLSSYSSVDFPHMDLMAPGVRGKLKEYMSKLAASGNTEWFTACTIRADAAAFKGYTPLLQMSVHAAKTYEISQKTDTSALYTIEGRITRLRDF